MHFITSAVVATAYFAINAKALPRPAVSYSVVDVAGSTASAITSPTTIYQTVTKSAAGAQATDETTVSITIIESPSTLPQTAASTSISTTTTTATTSDETFSTIYTGATTTPSIDPIVVEVSAGNGDDPSATVTLLSTVTAMPTQTTSTDFYDDGMWHTRYPKQTYSAGVSKAWNSTLDARGVPAPTASGAAAGLWYRAVATGSAGLYPRVAATGSAGLYPRVAATGSAGLYPRFAAATGGLAAPTGVVLGRAARTGGMGVRAAMPTGYSVVSWNETAW